MHHDALTCTYCASLSSTRYQTPGVIMQHAAPTLSVIMRGGKHHYCWGPVSDPDAGIKHGSAS